MDEYGLSSFGDLHAETYDAQHDPGTTEECVALIFDLANNGACLELAIGTGRIALPLAAKGLNISGIEGSPKMIAKLREKPGGEAISVTIGDFADVDIDGQYDFIFLVFNTLFNLTSQEAQVRCFKNVAERLKPGGRFLVEAKIPNVSRFQEGFAMRATQVDFESIKFEAATYDPVSQRIDFQRIRLTETGIKMAPLPMRYVWPGEIDLMAELAGLSLAERWGGWDRAPLSTDSSMHISLYQKPF